MNERFVAWAGTGWPEWALKLIGKDAKDAGIVWPIQDRETSGDVDGDLKPKQWYAVAFTPQAQAAICAALNAKPPK